MDRNGLRRQHDTGLLLSTTHEEVGEALKQHLYTTRLELPLASVPILLAEVTQEVRLVIEVSRVHK